VLQVNTAPEQLSLYAIVGIEIDAVHKLLSVDLVMSEAHVNDGLVLSTTVTVNEHVLTLFAASVNVYVTVVVPTGNASPEVWLDDTVTVPLQLSVAVGAVHVAT
jgi:hypothetical protein